MDAAKKVAPIRWLAIACRVTAVPDELVEQSALKRAMLFELAIARAERLLSGHLEPDWDECLQVATKRQSRHYDVKVPKVIAD